MEQTHYPEVYFLFQIDLQASFQNQTQQATVISVQLRYSNHGCAEGIALKHYLYIPSLIFAWMRAFTSDMYQQRVIFNKCLRWFARPPLGEHPRSVPLIMPGSFCQDQAPLLMLRTFSLEGGLPWLADTCHSPLRSSLIMAFLQA